MMVISVAMGRNTPCSETTMRGLAVIIRTVLYASSNLPNRYQNVPTHHEWVVIVLGVWTRHRIRGGVAVSLESNLALSQRVANLGYDVRERRVR